MSSLVALQNLLPENQKPESWVNVGGQLIKKTSLDKLINNIRNNHIDGWDDIHKFYITEAEKYSSDKLFSCNGSALADSWNLPKKISLNKFKELLSQSILTADWITKGIFNSRKKDYANPFRRMVYENEAEMDKVHGKLDDNSFIKNQNRIFDDIRIRQIIL